MNCFKRRVIPYASIRMDTKPSQVTLVIVLLDYLINLVKLFENEKPPGNPIAHEEMITLKDFQEVFVGNLWFFETIFASFRRTESEFMLCRM